MPHFHRESYENVALNFCRESYEMLQTTSAPAETSAGALVKQDGGDCVFLVENYILAMFLHNI